MSAQENYKTEGLAYTLYSVSGTLVGSFMFPFEAAQLMNRYLQGAYIMYRGQVAFTKSNDSLSLDSIVSVLNKNCDSIIQEFDAQSVSHIEEEDKRIEELEIRLLSVEAQSNRQYKALARVREVIGEHTTAIIKLQSVHSDHGHA